MEGGLKVNGTLIWYYYICRREVWLIGHGIEADQNNDFLILGRHIHEMFFQNKKKELLIDNRIKIDILPGNRVIGEIKKSSKFLHSAIMQLAFYLYYMKYEKGIELEGELIIPEEKKRIPVSLSEELEKEIEKAIKGIEEIMEMEKPPKPVKTHYCKYCAYKELCWA